MVRLALRPRPLAALLAFGGLVLTMNADPPAVRPRVMKAGYTVLSADLHVHSFPGDGALAPWDIAIEARRRHLDAVALTNHNSMHSWRLSRWLAPVTERGGGALLIPGEELTAAGYHLAIVGVTTPVDWRQPAAAAAAAAHARGGVAIAAHPSRESWPFLDDAALAALDGVEVHHPMGHGVSESQRDLAAFYQRATRAHPSIAAIGSSDYHHFAPVGLGRTYLLVREATQAGILDAIRAGRTIACSGYGEAHGPEELVAMLADDCRRDALSRPAGEHALDRVGTWLVWLGLVALVVLGADEVGLR